jgi:polyhydroxyalkanoate synthesis regulator phasin
MPDENPRSTSGSGSGAPRAAKPAGGGSRKSTAARKPAARTSAGSTAAKSPRASAAAKSPRASTAAKSPRASTAAKSPRATSARKPASGARSSTSSTPAAGAPAAPPPKAGDPLRVSLTRVRDIFTQGIVVSRERVQETMDDAVKRGRLVRRDADELTERLLSAGRQQTQDIVADIEQLLGRGREQVGTATRSARVQATRRSEAVLREVDRARRRAGIGSFPILGYDDLTAEQIVRRLPDLSPAELRKVRDYELRHGNRKSVVGAIERRLA